VRGMADSILGNLMEAFFFSRLRPLSIDARDGGAVSLRMIV
jgi:hypothetical protein